MDPAARRAQVLSTVREQVPAHLDAFYVVDLAEVERKYHEWVAELPRVRPFYAVKCNDDPRIVSTLASLGTGFDCATKTEISMCLGLGVKPSDIIFAHPAKQPSHLHYARDNGVVRTTFDNADELVKVAKEHPGSEVVLRILTDDSHSVCRLGLKFGAPPDQVHGLLAKAVDLGLKPVGISYHVGSGNGHAASFGDAVREARRAFDVGRSLGITSMHLLDIGGGFPGSELGAPEGSATLHADPDSDNPYSKHPSFKTIAAVVRQALDEHFPAGCGVDIIAEPGRYFVKSSHVLAVNVIGKRCTLNEEASDAMEQTRFNYYLNDGLYGSFNCVLYDHVTCAPSLLLSQRDLAAVVEDTVARINADGDAVVADMTVGAEHAALLQEEQSRQVVMQVVAAAAAEVQEHGLSMSMGGHASSVGSSHAPSGARAMCTATSSVGSGSLGDAGFAYHSLAAAVAPAATEEALLPQRRLPTTLWGPTCDSMDKISDNVGLPELEVGDWLVYENMGAYTIAGSCRFNGFPLSTKVYMHRDGSVEIQKEEVTPSPVRLA